MTSDGPLVSEDLCSEIRLKTSVCEASDPLILHGCVAVLLAIVEDESVETDALFLYLVREVCLRRPDILREVQLIGCSI